MATAAPVATEKPVAAPPPAKDIAERAVESAAKQAEAAEKDAQNAWQAAKEAGKKAKPAKLDAHVVPDDDGDGGDESEVPAGAVAHGDADDDTDGEEPSEAGAAGETEKPADEKTEAEKAAAAEAERTAAPTRKEWKEFLARKDDTEKRLASRATRLTEREAKLVHREAYVVGELEKREHAANDKLRAAEQRVASLKLDSDDPYEVWQSLAKWKGWDPKESFGTVTRRTIHGGELTLEDQLKATETKFEAELRKRDEESKRKDEEATRLKQEADDARQREHEARVTRDAYSAIATDADVAFKAGKYRFIQAKHSPQDVGQLAYDDMLRHYIQTSRRDAQGRVIPGTGEEVPLDKYLDSWEHHLKQDYERLHRAASSEGSGTNPNGSVVGQGNGAPQGANPGTQQSNGSAQRGPKTVTRSLAAQRSELNRPLSDAEDWEESKRIAKQRATS